MPNISLATWVRRKPAAHMAEFVGELVMMNVVRGEYYGLDGVGTQIWNRLEEPIRVADLIDSLSEIFDADSSVITDDVCEFLTELAAQDLLTIAPLKT